MEERVQHLMAVHSAVVVYTPRGGGRGGGGGEGAIL